VAAFGADQGLTRPLVVTAAAEHQIRAASEWWYEHRESAPGLFGSELRRAFELIVQYPEAAPTARHPELPGVRRVLLPRTRFYLYYRVAPGGVEVLALWHTSRGESPRL
jgi:plasmid stabilization system protein ParE